MGLRGPKPKEREEKAADIEIAAEANTQAPAEPLVDTPAPAIATVSKCDSWRYHEEETPRIFKEGEKIPAGWYDSQDPLKQLWFRHATDGSFTRIPRS